MDDAVALSANSADSMIRFANNSVSVVNRVEEAALTVYLAKGGKRAIASTSNLEPTAVKEFVRDLHASMKGLPESEAVPLPGRAKYRPSRLGFDRGLEDVDAELPGLAKSAIASSIAAGGKRSAGVINAGKGTGASVTCEGGG